MDAAAYGKLVADDLKRVVEVVKAANIKAE